MKLEDRASHLENGGRLLRLLIERGILIYSIHGLEHSRQFDHDNLLTYNIRIKGIISECSYGLAKIGDRSSAKYEPILYWNICIIPTPIRCDGKESNGTYQMPKSTERFRKDFRLVESSS